VTDFRPDDRRECDPSFTLENHIASLRDTDPERWALLNAEWSDQDRGRESPQDGAIALRAPSPLGLRPEPLTGLGHPASVNYRGEQD
jgi:hypothetical protein